MFVSLGHRGERFSSHPLANQFCQEICERHNIFSDAGPLKGRDAGVPLIEGYDSAGIPEPSEVQTPSWAVFRSMAAAVEQCVDTTRTQNSHCRLWNLREPRESSLTESAVYGRGERI